MTAMTHWNPFKEMDELSNQLSSLWGTSPNRIKNGLCAGSKVTDWTPRVDIVEDENEYLIKADLPAVDKKDVKVTVDDGVLTVSGERKPEKKEEDGKTYHRVERVYGSFTRRFSLPENVDGTKVRAEYKNGELELHLPKAPEAKPKTIEVKVG
jgi:HSP20 family protein